MHTHKRVSFSFNCFSQLISLINLILFYLCFVLFNLIWFFIWFVYIVECIETCTRDDRYKCTARFCWNCRFMFWNRSKFDEKIFKIYEEISEYFLMHNTIRILLRLFRFRFGKYEASKFIISVVNWTWS